MSKGTITIQFDTESVDAEDFIDNAVVSVGNQKDGSPCVSSGQMMNLLVRVLSVLTILSGEKVSDAYYASSQFSGLIADSVRQALEKKFQIMIHLESKPEDRN